MSTCGRTQVLGPQLSTTPLSGVKAQILPIAHRLLHDLPRTLLPSLTRFQSHGPPHYSSKTPGAAPPPRPASGPLHQLCLLTRRPFPSGLHMAVFSCLAGLSSNVTSSGVPPRCPRLTSTSICLSLTFTPLQLSRMMFPHEHLCFPSLIRKPREGGRWRGLGQCWVGGALRQALSHSRCSEPVE